MMIHYNVPALTGGEQAYLRQVMEGGRFSGDGPFSRRCEEVLAARLPAKRVLLTPSGTAALELAALLLDVKAGDEVIMPSFTFVSTANAFALRGATIVFVDVNSRTMNMDPEAVRAAVTARTRVIVPVHYAGVACDLDTISTIAHQAGAAIVEDAAQGIGATYKGRSLGTLGTLGCLSFHETKNIHCGEGGALIINDPRLINRAEILREKGTNRANFIRGEVDKYSWVDIGSSFLPNEMSAAFLLAQLEGVREITDKRMARWRRYWDSLANSGLGLPDPPEECDHNAHIFWVKARDEAERNSLIELLRADGVQAPFHYVPLHSTSPGAAVGRFCGEDKVTSRDAGRLLRLPLYPSLRLDEQDGVIGSLLRLTRQMRSR